MQQELGSLFGAKDMIPWDLYNPDDLEYLVKKVALMIPELEGDDLKTIKENKRLGKIRDAVVTAAWNQRKYYGRNLLMSIVYVLCTNYTENKLYAQHQTSYGVYPLMRIRKCCKDNDSTDCCMVFVDDNGRVYQDWDDYLENNNLPEGILVAPRKGYYNFNEGGQVLLQCEETPAAKPLSKAGDVINTTAGIAGLGAAGVTIASLALPVAAPVLIGAAVVGIGSGICGAVSSIVRLVDRGKHEENINLSNSQARADWLGVAGGVVSIGASGATSVLSRFAATGRNVSSIARGAVNGLNLATIAINGFGAGNSAIEIITKVLNDEKVSPIDVAQLGASLFLVTHSVYNFQTASQIVNSSRDATIQTSRKALSNRQRKAFDRAYKETIRLKGQNQGKMDVIRALNKMPDSKQPLNDLFKINKQLNENGLKASFNPDGKILLNNDLAIESGVLRQNLQHGIGDSIPARVAAAPVNPVEYSGMVPSGQQNHTFSRPALDQVVNFSQLLGITVLAAIDDTSNLEECVMNILRSVTKEGLKTLCRIASEYYEKNVKALEEALTRFIPFEEVLWKVFEIVKKECGLHDIESFIEKLDFDFIQMKLAQVYQNLKPKLGSKVKCSKCGGYFTICAI